MKSFALSFRVLLLLSLLLFPAPQAHAALEFPKATLTLLKDINTANADSSPIFLHGFQDVYIFSATDGIESKIYYSDGTLAGTNILTDVTTGTAFGLKDKAVFISYSKEPGIYSRLYVTDGSPQGTQVIYDFQDDYLTISSAAEVGSWLYFIIYRNLNYELWRTDGTAQNTGPVVTGLSLYHGTNVTPEIAALNGSLYLNGKTLGMDMIGYELWRIPSAGDLVIGSPELVKDICHGSCESGYGNSDPHHFAQGSGRLYFVADDPDHGQELWATDGTTAGTVLVRDVNPGIEGSNPDQLTAAGGDLFFIAGDGMHGREVWQTSGSDPTTSLVQDIYPGSVSSSPHNLTGFNGNLFFAANDPDHGVELWRVDGANRTAERVEIAPGNTGSGPAGFSALNDVVYFTAQDTNGDRELWKWNESGHTVSRVKDIVPGPDGSSPRDLHAWKGRLVFSAVDPVYNREPWVSDGTTMGTVMMGDLNTNQVRMGSMPSYFRTLANQTFFQAYDALHGNELWATQGTPDTTMLIRDFVPGPSDGYVNIADMVELNGIVYFTATDSTSYTSPRPEEIRQYGYELWRTDGTPQGTWMIKDILPGPDGSYPNHFAVMDGKVYFLANDGVHYYALWRTDGTSAGTGMVTSISSLDYQTVKVAVLNHSLIFALSNTPTSGQISLYRSDGTASGTSLFKTQNFSSDIYNNSLVMSHQGFVYLGYRSNLEYNDFLMKTDGTANGTNLIYFPGVDYVRAPYEMVARGNNLLFITQTQRGDFYGYSLWKLPVGSNSAEWVVDLSGILQAKLLLAVGENRFFFLTYDGVTANWWRSDGTADGTSVICPGCWLDPISVPTIWQNRLFFTANRGQGSEIWFTDGSDAGFQRLADVDPGLSIVNPTEISGAPLGLFISADYYQEGQEPWVYALDLTEKTRLPLVSR